MSPAVKYSLGRLGLFVVVFAALLPLPMNFLVKAMIALIASAGFALLLLRKWRDEMAEQLGSIAQRRSAEKARLRSALAGDDEAAAAGDRVADADAKADAPAGTPSGAPVGAPGDAKAGSPGDAKAGSPADPESDTDK